MYARAWPWQLKPSAADRRIQEDEGISDKLMMITADTIYKDSVCKRDVELLNIRALAYWLGTIDAKRGKPEIYEKVVHFKRSFAETAWQVYRSDLMRPQDDVLLITLLNFGFVSLTKIDVSLVHKLHRAVRKNDTSSCDVLLPVQQC
jgi:hypothetical protein